MKLRPDEKELVRLMLASKRIDRDTMQKALGKLKSRRKQGRSTTLQELLVKKGLASKEEIENLLKDPSGPTRNRKEVWREYSEADSASFTDSLERKRRRSKNRRGKRRSKTKTQSTRQPVEGFALAETATEVGDTMTAQVDFGNLGNLEDTNTDTKTMAIDAKAAALAALEKLGARAAEEERRKHEEEQQRKAEQAKQRPVIIGVVLLLLVVIGGVGFVLLSDDKAKPGPDKAQATDPKAKKPQLSEAEVKDLKDKASSLERGEMYGDARQVWQTLGNDKNAAEPLKEQVNSNLMRLRHFENFKNRSDRVLNDVRDLRNNSQFKEAMGILEQLLAAHPKCKDSPTAKRLERLQANIREQANAQIVSADGKKPRIPRPKPFGDKPKDPKNRDPKNRDPKTPKTAAYEPLPPEPAARTQQFKTTRERGRVRVRDLRLRIQQAKRAQQQRFLKEAKRVLAESKNQPQDVSLSKGFKLRGAVVSAYDEKGFTLSARKSQVSFRWDSADPLLAYKIRRMGVGEDALSWLDLGRFCMERRLFDQAERAYDKARSLKSNLDSRIPDVKTLEHNSRLFRGQFKRLGGGFLELDYDFQTTDQQRDFDSASRFSVRRDRLEITGQKIFYARLKNLVFRDEVSVSFSPRSASRKALIAAGVTVYKKGRSSPEGLLFAYQPSTLAVVLLSWQNGGSKPVQKAQRLPRSPKKLTFDFDGHIVRLRADGKKIFQHPWIDEDERRVRVVLAGVSLKQDTVSFNDLHIRGDAGYVWLRKTFGAADSKLRAAMAATEGLSTFARTEKNKHWALKANESCSAEDEYGLQRVGRTARNLYFKAAKEMRSEKVREFLRGLGKMQDLAKELPYCAAIRYRVAQGLRRLSRRREAHEHLQAAVKYCPRFYEAMALLARSYLDLDKRKQASEWARKALDLKPDSAIARYVTGRIHFLEGRIGKARGNLELAVALNPWNDDAQTLRRNINYVVEGPPWQRSYTYESDHFRIETDISQSKARYYGDHLEAMREYYCEQFGLDPDQRSENKARVLIFDNREGFHSYAKLTTDDRVESFLGYYHPRFQQLLLFEGRRDDTGQETLRVLYHEGFHQFCHGLITNIPFWLSEGLAEYYAASVVEDGQVVKRGLLLLGRVRDLKRYLKVKKPISFKRLMLESPSEFYSGPVSYKYAQAWSMVHFLINYKKGQYLQTFGQYIKYLRRGDSSAKAFQQSFGKLKMSELESDWRGYVKKW